MDEGEFCGAQNYDKPSSEAFYWAFALRAAVTLHFLIAETP
jgi:hypothetical protein